MIQQMDEIKLSPSAYQTIVTHALTHEKEEIIGLLFAEECNTYIQIFAAKPCLRTTHLPNRVEMSNQELAEGIQEAEVSTKGYLRLTHVYCLSMTAKFL